jgi:hypothetical protein
MTTQTGKRRASPFAVWPACFVVLLALYLASLGLVNRLVVQDRITRPTYELLCDTLYAPVIWVELNTELLANNPLGRAYGRYLEWCVRSAVRM